MVAVVFHENGEGKIEGKAKPLFLLLANMSDKWKVLGLLCCVCVSVCGAPVEDTNRKSVLELLGDLNVTCSENPFLNNASMFDDPMFVHCAENPAKLKRSDLYCLSFLDVNRRLCDLRNIAAFNWSERIRTAESNEPTTDFVCDPTAGISFSDLEEYPTYKKTIDSVFHNKVACFSLCLLRNEDVIDVRVNYFCKVLYYGTAIMESVTKDSDAVSVTHGTPLKFLIPPVDNVVSDIKTDVKTVETRKYFAEQPLVEGNVPAERPHSETSLMDGPNIIPINYKHHQTSTTNRAIQRQQIKAPLNRQGKQEHVEDPIVDMKQVQKLSKPAVDNNQMETNGMKPPTVDKGPSKTHQEEKLQYKLTSTVLNKELVKDQDEDQNPDDAPDLDYDPDDNTRMNDQDSAGVVSPQLQQADMPKQKAGTLRQEQISVDKELAAAYIPPDYSEVDDGSFVPLFFFGVFSMVLLYILYHNKNKIMGLMIEGRQDRRRNSRGHAYRRLDTLEQAMSSNPTTTPSKIIY